MGLGDLTDCLQIGFFIKWLIIQYQSGGHPNQSDRLNLTGLDEEYKQKNKQLPKASMTYNLHSITCQNGTVRQVILKKANKRKRKKNIS